MSLLPSFEEMARDESTRYMVENFSSYDLPEFLQKFYVNFEDFVERLPSIFEKEKTSLVLQLFGRLMGFYRELAIDQIELTLLQMSLQTDCDDLECISTDERVCLYSARKRLLAIGYEYCKIRGATENLSLPWSKRYQQIFFDLPYMFEACKCARLFNYFLLNNKSLHFAPFMVQLLGT
ncbi:hypothetical protein Ciccas_009447 [Cichlidogyrus casuarinus]|uniref:Caspase recruitment domain family member 4 n=1 Tax=Cichlidogyrus casuarinus TaxID=1844966 RepID=A0ABD2PX16_9PLAT